MAKNIFIHVGVGKSGTTSLQENVFCRIPDVACLGRPNHRNDACRNFSFGIRLAEDYQLDDYCLPFVSMVRAVEQDVVVISDESIRTEVDSLAASRLARYFPEAHIFITTRNQFSAIPSFYVSHGRFVHRSPVSQRSLYVSFREYMDFYLKFHCLGYFREIKYHQLACVYAEKFGRSNVTVMTFEEMVQKPEQFFGQLGTLLQTDAKLLLALWSGSERRHAGHSGRLHAYMRFRSKLPVKSFRQMLLLPNFASSAVERFLRRGTTAKVALTDNDRERIAAIYASENRMIEQDFNVSLGAWGYPH